jgi:hypothetical protein
MYIYSTWREPHFLSELYHACDIEERRHKEREREMNKREKQRKGK